MLLFCVLSVMYGQVFPHIASNCKCFSTHRAHVRHKVFTTSEFRLKRERNKLDSKIEKGYAELKKVEGLVDKKLELNKKLPRHGNNEPSAPNMEDSITKVSGAVRAEVDVHTVKDVRYVPRPIHNHKCSSSSKRTSE